MMVPGPWWWPYVFILIAGWLATDIWRWLGVLIGNRLDENSESLQWVRAVATSLVAAVIAKLILFPSGTLAGTPLWLRLGSAVIGFGIFLATGRKPAIGIAASLGLLIAGLYVLGY
jgi:hypothetical protein